ncbi:zinc finger, C2H2 type [Ancylostoma duodenale]|uniref:Zinc finger, C2H2 type n=1 Tax=Ancylostoma duodenale TaxID=51022 RepID=A0A0C2DFE4_9BILA|nr:zinc finger, C2H2 type [Ancylostoma duodenale]
MVLQNKIAPSLPNGTSVQRAVLPVGPQNYSFICEICGKAFRFRSNLAEHRSVHTALKPYVCKYCGKSSRLKGNLTKHILKHHKKEQNEQIGKDDIIIKKDPAAVDFLEKSMIVMAQNTNNDSSTPSLLPKEETNDQERSILISLGLDYNHSLDLRDSPEASASPENGTYGSIKPEYIEDQSYGSPLPNNTVLRSEGFGNGVRGSESSSVKFRCSIRPLLLDFVRRLSISRQISELLGAQSAPRTFKTSQ